MENLDYIAKKMLDESPKYAEANQRIANYHRKQFEQSQLTEKEYKSREMARRMRILKEEFVFEENEDVTIFVDSWKAFNIHNPDVDAIRQRFRDGYCHRHEFFELRYVRKGYCYAYIDGKEEIHSAGTCCLFNLQAAHESTFADADSEVIVVCIRRSAFELSILNVLRENASLWNFFSRSIFNLEEPACCIKINTNHNDDIEAFLYHMLRIHMAGKCFSQEILKCLFVCLLTELAVLDNEAFEHRLKATNETASINTIAQIIKEECNTITLNALAERYHFTPSYMSRYIKKHTGKSYNDLLNEARVLTAKSLLERSQISVHDIASAMGYSSRSNFERSFKNTVGITPSQYRQQIESLAAAAKT